VLIVSIGDLTSYTTSKLNASMLTGRGSFRASHARAPPLIGGDQLDLSTAGMYERPSAALIRVFSGEFQDLFLPIKPADFWKSRECSSLNKNRSNHGKKVA
jgi:hypothetical protein